jgi:prophage regulatory protein
MLENRIVRPKELKQLTGLTRQSIYRLEQEGHFPKRRKLTSGIAVGWLLSEVVEWMASREQVAA